MWALGDQMVYQGARDLLAPLDSLEAPDLWEVWARLVNGEFPA